MTEPVTFDVRPLNDPSALRASLLILIGGAVALAAGALVFGGLPLVGVAKGASSTGSNNPGYDLFLVVALGGAAAVLLVLASVLGAPRASYVTVSDQGIEFVYSPHRKRVFRWDDPRLRLRFLDHIGMPGHPYANLRRIEVWLPFTAWTNVPPEVIGVATERARAAGVVVTSRPHPPTHGKIIEFLGPRRRPPGPAPE